MNEYIPTLRIVDAHHNISPVSNPTIKSTLPPFAEPGGDLVASQEVWLVGEFSNMTRRIGSCILPVESSKAQTSILPVLTNAQRVEGNEDGFAFSSCGGLVIILFIESWY
jgi:hypothetical protein